MNGASSRFRQASSEGWTIDYHRDVGAVIVTHSRPELAVRCVAAVTREISPADLVVVANLPQTAAQLTSLECQLVVNRSPCGYGENLNRGVKALGGRHRYLLFLNDDAIPAPGSIHLLAATLERDPSVAIAGPRLTDGDGGCTRSTYRFPRLMTTAVGSLMLPASVTARLPQRWFGVAVDEEAEWLLGAALLIRADAFEAVNGFDEGFFLNFEEVDLARRLSNTARTVRFVPDAVVRHLGHASIEPALMDATFVESFSRYVALHWPVWQRLCLPAALALVRLWNRAAAATAGALRPRKRESFAAARQAKLTRLPRARSVLLSVPKSSSKGTRLGTSRFTPRGGI